HQVPAGDSPPAPGDHHETRTGESSVSCCFVLLCIAEQYKAACLHSEPCTAHLVKQHTINPLIAPDVNPFLPSVISTVSVLFISTDHCISVTGDVNGSYSVPPSVRMPAAVPL
ncbi:unnamed protein product, partial [Staurois parvus]